METVKLVNDQLNSSCKVEKVDEDLMKLISFTASGSLCPMQAVIGGIVAQEVMKVFYLFFLNKYFIKYISGM